MAREGGQRVLVTAAAAGIGEAIAARFLASGARVAICDLDGDAIVRARDAHADIAATVVDVADGAAVQRWIEDLTGRWGGIDVLVNNAGIGGPNAPIEEITVEDWQRCLDVNLTGAFHCIRSAAPVMKAQRSGCILNISTPSAVLGLPNRSPYVASKAGLLGLTLNVARELGPCNVRCNAILPGAVDNARGRRVLAAVAERASITVEEAEAALLRHISMRTWVQASEIADLAVFLASPAGRHITGQRIAVDGNVEWEE